MVVDGRIEEKADRTVPSDGAEEELVRLSRAGDMAAYARLVERYQDRLYTVLLRMVGNPDDALELTQDALVRAMQGLKRFRGQSGFYTWLFRIGYNLCLNYCQRRKRVKFTSLQGNAQLIGHQADGLANLVDRGTPSPAKNAELQESHQQVLAALDRLEEPLRTVVVLRDIEQMDYAQIAKIIDVPVGTIKSRLFRARMTLRAELLGKMNE